MDRGSETQLQVGENCRRQISTSKVDLVSCVCYIDMWVEYTRKFQIMCAYIYIYAYVCAYVFLFVYIYVCICMFNYYDNVTIYTVFQHLGGPRDGGYFES